MGLSQKCFWKKDSSTLLPEIKFIHCIDARTCPFLGFSIIARYEAISRYERRHEHYEQ